MRPEQKSVAGPSVMPSRLGPYGRFVMPFRPPTAATRLARGRTLLPTVASRADTCHVARCTRDGRTLHVRRVHNARETVVLCVIPFGTRRTWSDSFRCCFVATKSCSWVRIFPNSKSSDSSRASDSRSLDAAWGVVWNPRTYEQRENELTTRGVQARA